MDQNPLSLAWRKSSASGTGNCVEVAMTPDTVFVRDTKDRQGPALQFTQDEWGCFLQGVAGGEFARSAFPQP